MFNLFGRKPTKDLRDIEQIIFDVAEYNKDEDFHRLYELMIGRELFLPVDPDTLPGNSKPGDKVVTDSSMQIKVKNVQAPNGDTLVPCATLESSQLVKDGYIGMDWFGFLEMVLKIPEASGVLIQGKTSWVGFDKGRVQYILEKYNV
jgi:hypothetical protein